jgi:hypothetical protein
VVLNLFDSLIALLGGDTTIKFLVEGHLTKVSDNPLELFLSLNLDILAGFHP